MTAIRDMTKVGAIVIHCADALRFEGSGRLVTAQDVDDWHHERGWHRRLGPEHGAGPLVHAGYHAVIERDGKVVRGRAWLESGSHCAMKGFNETSLGVCLVGVDKFTLAQWDALKRWCDVASAELAKTYDKGPILYYGHCDIDFRKTCPNFDVLEWVRGGMAPLPNHTMEDDNG